MKVDRASMLASLEVRAPFLDHTLVEFLARVPPHLKLRGSTTKVLLKRAVAELLPPGHRRAQEEGLRHPGRRVAEDRPARAVLDLLSPARLASQGLFDAARGRAPRRASTSPGTRDHRKQLWTLLMFQLWHDVVRAPRARARRPVARGGRRVKKLNLGSGAFPKDGYVNVDLFAADGADVVHDLSASRIRSPTTSSTSSRRPTAWSTCPTRSR